MSATQQEILRHFVAALAYRMNKVIDDAPDSFPTYEVGGGVRTPLEILAHVGDVLAFTHATLTRTERERSELVDWEAEVVRFNQLLTKLDSALRTIDELETETALRLVQGPLSDAMTHVGQLAMIRRLAGAPVAGENYFAANIHSGDHES